jgi:hypothetical protein
MDSQQCSLPHVALHCAEYPEEDKPLSVQEKFRYERGLVLVALQMIQLRNCHPRYAVDHIRDEVKSSMALSVSAEVLLSNLKDVCPHSL